mmetsp:Transcript_36149/g.114955  ORF Transcript_36149/g.114955 Transcript_36149/m.114955 type:complete len:275 (-) Transcript_36149:12-836(-)
MIGWPRKRSTRNGCRRSPPTSSCSHGGMAPAKTNVWREDSVCGGVSSNARTSCARAVDSISSASSTTSTRMHSALISPSLAISQTRPGVPMMSWAPRRSRARCASIACWPPPPWRSTTFVARSRRRLAARYACSARPRVGSRTTAGSEPSHPSPLARSRSGRRNARVLPVPPREMASTSRPSRMGRSTCCCTSVGLRMPKRRTLACMGPDNGSRRKPWTSVRSAAGALGSGKPVALVAHLRPTGPQTCRRTDLQRSLLPSGYLPQMRCMHPPAL